MHKAHLNLVHLSRSAPHARHTARGTVRPRCPASSPGRRQSDSGSRPPSNAGHLKTFETLPKCRFQIRCNSKRPPSYLVARSWKTWSWTPASSVPARISGTYGTFGYFSQNSTFVHICWYFFYLLYLATYASICFLQCLLYIF